LRFWCYYDPGIPDAITRCGVRRMKIRSSESGKAAVNTGHAEEKILPKDRPKGLVSSRGRAEKRLTPLEKGMLVAEVALKDVPDVREELVAELKERIRQGEYEVSGKEVAEMMLRRLAADRMR